MKKILVLGGTGAFGAYLIDELLRREYRVDVVSLDARVSYHKNLSFLQADAKAPDFLEETLKNDYDCIVDFLIYFKSEFAQRYKTLLNRTRHYIFLSTYRIYADSKTPITESSPRLLDTMQDPAYLAETEREYSLYKACEEDMLKNSSFRNWTILRPSISYSKRRFQLVTLEANTLLPRAQAGKPVVLPEEAMHKQTTLTWAGDSARMMAALVLNEKAYGETYTIATAEHHTWQEVASMYQELIGLKYVTVDTETYMRLWSVSNSPYARYQLFFDRLFDRVIDNSKILAASGLGQEALMPLYDGLKKELSALPQGIQWNDNGWSQRMDQFLAAQ